MELVNDSAANRSLENGAGTTVARFLLDSLKGSLGEDALAQANALCARQFERPWGLIVVMSDSKHDLSVNAVESEVLSRLTVNVEAVKLDDHIIVFLSHSDTNLCVRELIGSDIDERDIAVSLPFDDVSAIPQQYNFAMYCLESSSDARARKSQAKALDYLKSAILDNVEVSGMLHPALTALAQYDRENQSEMLETLRVYLENDRNAQRCANMLYLHRNSLQYRVRRIQEIANIDLDNPDERAYLRLSLFLSE